MQSENAGDLVARPSPAVAPAGYTYIGCVTSAGT